MSNPDNVRFAGDILLPWSAVARQEGDPLWVGRNEQQYNNASEDLRQKLVKLIDDGYDGERLASRLIQKFGYGKDEAREQIYEIDQALSKGRRPPKDLRQIRSKVANAQADEQLAMRAMQLSNFDPVTQANAGAMFATDLSATIGGEKLGIDAQARIGRNMALGVIQNAPGIEDKFVNGNERLIDTIDMYREQNYGNNMQRLMSGKGWQGFEDKLLHTTDPEINRRPSKVFEDETDKYNKDMLITSLRPGDYRYNNKRSPYDRKLPAQWDLIDLDTIRGQVMDKTYSQLVDMGLDVQQTDKGNGIKLSLPPSYVRSLDSRAKVSDEVNERFVNTDYQKENLRRIQRR